MTHTPQDARDILDTYAKIHDIEGRITTLQADSSSPAVQRVTHYLRTACFSGPSEYEPTAPTRLQIQRLLLRDLRDRRKALLLVLRHFGFGPERKK